MRRFFEIVWLELTGLVRSKTLAMLLVASVGWMLAFPYVVKADGTLEGARELYLHYALGGVFALLVVTLLASATGSLARERAAKRLQLTMVRPIRHSLIVLGKMLAHVLVGAVVLGAAVAVLLCRTDLSRSCYHVCSPVLPSVEEEARDMYAAYMADPETPEAVRKAKKSVVLRMLEGRAYDHYQVMATNSVTSWKIRVPAKEGERLVRMRFSAQYDTRQEVYGTFRYGAWTGVVSNITQSVLAVPLAQGAAPDGDCAEELQFFNAGKHTLMLRPRKDIALLVTADGIAGNILRAYVALVAILALVIALGTFLSAGLGRAVALFVAIVTLIVSEISPSIVEQYPDELEANAVDRIGLTITRTAAQLTQPISSASPLEALSRDECVEWGSLGHLIVVDLLLLPLLLSLLSAVLVPRRSA